MYDLNQIPYNYIVEMMNRFKELDLLDRGKGEREKVHPAECRVPENSRETRRPSKMNNTKKQKKTIE